LGVLVLRRHREAMSMGALLRYSLTFAVLYLARFGLSSTLASNRLPRNNSKAKRHRLNSFAIT